MAPHTQTRNMRPLLTGVSPCCRQHDRPQLIRGGQRGGAARGPAAARAAAAARPPPPLHAPAPPEPGAHGRTPRGPAALAGPARPAPRRRPPRPPAPRPPVGRAGGPRGRHQPPQVRARTGHSSRTEKREPRIWGNSTQKPGVKKNIFGGYCATYTKMIRKRRNGSQNVL